MDSETVAGTSTPFCASVALLICIDKWL